MITINDPDIRLFIVVNDILYVDIWLAFCGLKLIEDVVIVEAIGVIEVVIELTE